MKAARLSGLFLSVTLLATSCDAEAGKKMQVVVEKSALAPRGEPLITGVGVHYGIGGSHNYTIQQGLAALKDLGVDSYRDDIPWSVFDPDGNGQGNGQPAKLFQFMKLAPQRPALVLGYSNPSIPDTSPPLTDAAREKFSDFIKNAVQATAHARPIYEVWNEWNMNAVKREGWLKGPGPESDPRASIHYARLAKAAVPAVRLADPSATVLFGGVGEDSGWKWTKSMVEETGFGDDMPLSVHIYNQCKKKPERTATEMYDRLTLLQQTVPPGGSRRPVFITEFGWPTAPDHSCEISREVAGENMGQFLLWSASQFWIKGVWAYQLKDTGLNPADLEKNFGLFDTEYRPKPAACAMREAIRLIKSSTKYQLQRPAPDFFVLQLESDTGLRFAAWKTAMTPNAHISIGNTGATAKTLCSGPVEQKDGIFAVGGDPVVFEIPSAEQITFSAAPG